MHRETEILGFPCSKQSWAIQQSKVRHFASNYDHTVFTKSLSLNTKNLQGLGHSSKSTGFSDVHLPLMIEICV